MDIPVFFVDLNDQIGWSDLFGDLDIQASKARIKNPFNFWVRHPVEAFIGWLDFYSSQFAFHSGVDTWTE